MGLFTMPSKNEFKKSEYGIIFITKEHLNQEEYRFSLMALRWKHTRNRELWLFFMLWILAVVAGCGTFGGGKWYKKGSYQADFDRDCIECDLLANTKAKEDSVSGRSRNFEVYTKAYNHCLFSKGWSHIPPHTPTIAGFPGEQSKAVDEIPRLCRFYGNRISGLGRELILPAGFTVLRHAPSTYGPTRMTSVFCRGPGLVFFNIIFQASDSLHFKKADYPVAPPFFLFDKSDYKDGLQWSAFCGITNKEWVGGVGAYIDIDPTRRIIIVATRPLPAAKYAPPPGLRLTAEQYQPMSTFTKWVCRWLHEDVRKSDCG